MPFLGIYRHYLVLEDAAGQRKKVLLPAQNFKKGEESLLPGFEADQQLFRENLSPQKYFIYDLKKGAFG